MTAWPPGPWDTEPKEGNTWVDEVTRIQCETKRHPSLGHWCGYITVPDASWLEAFNTEYGYDIPGAHGGITFDGVLEDGSVKVGFDCAHAWDNSPTRNYSDGEYRTLAYVETCIRTMARAVVAEHELRAALAGV